MMNWLEKTWKFIMTFGHNLLIFTLNFIKSSVSSSLLKSIFWFLLTLFFGLLQSIIILGKSWIFTEMTIASEFEKFIMSGALLFFSTTVVASLTIDYFFFRKSDMSQVGVGIFFVLFPSLILIVCVSLFTMLHGNVIAEVSVERVSIVEYWILAATAAYAIFVKTQLQSVEKSMENNRCI
jgi:hypothetical protein